MTFLPFLLFLNALGANQQPQCWPRTVIAIFDFSFPYGVDPDRDVHTKHFSFFKIDLTTIIVLYFNNYDISSFFIIFECIGCQSATIVLAQNCNSYFWFFISLWGRPGQRCAYKTFFIFLIDLTTIIFSYFYYFWMHWVPISNHSAGPEL